MKIQTFNKQGEIKKNKLTQDSQKFWPLYSFVTCYLHQIFTPKKCLKPKIPTVSWGAVSPLRPGAMEPQV